MSDRTARGTKRKCQNEDCAASFYDLNRETFDCPICGTAFDLEAHDAAVAQQRDNVPDYIRRRQRRDLPIVASEEPENNDVDEDEDDGEATGEAAADILLEDDDDNQDPLADAIPLSDADEEDI